MTQRMDSEQALAPVAPAVLKAELEKEPMALDSSDGAAELNEQATVIVQRLLEVDPDNQQARDQARSAIEQMSHKLHGRAARKSAILKEPIHKLSRRADDGGPVANALVDLKNQVEELDPVRFDFSAGWLSRMLGYLPFVGTPIKRYFSRYEAASTVIEAIVVSLEQGREQLRRDNITLQGDQGEMRELSQQLMRAAKLGQLIDAELSARLEHEIPDSDPRHSFVQEELLFPLRQRIQDLQQQLAVNQQGVLTTEIIVRNNRELIRGVDRATNVTVNALQVAVTLALALANQKIVLEKIQAVNETTNNLIANTAAQLREQGAAVHQQAASAQLDIETLRIAFADINSALEDIAQFRREALPAMAQNIAELDELAQLGEASIARLDSGRQSVPILEIEVA